MSSVSALLGAASRLAGVGRRGDLAPSVDVAGPVEGLPAQTTMLVGGDDPRLGEDPVLAAWFARVVGAVSDERPVAVGAAGRLGRTAVWPILAEGGGAFDAGALEGAIPAGTAWVVGTRPDRFFAQAATRLEARGDERGADWAARLRAPTGNLALLGKLVRTVAITLQVAPTGPSVLRLRFTCADAGTALQTAVALHAWRLRRGMGEGSAAAAFRGSDLVRVGVRVELVLPGSVDTLTRLFGRA